MKYLVIPLTLLAFGPLARAQPPLRVPDLRQALEQYRPDAASQQGMPVLPQVSQWKGAQPPAAAAPQQRHWQPRQLSPEERVQLRRELAEYGNPPRRQP